MPEEKNLTKVPTGGKEVEFEIEIAGKETLAIVSGKKLNFESGPVGSVHGLFLEIDPTEVNKLQIDRDPNTQKLRIRLAR